MRAVCEGVSLSLAFFVFISAQSASIEGEDRIEEYECPAKATGNSSAFCECIGFYEIKCHHLEYIPFFAANKLTFNGFYAKNQDIPQLAQHAFHNLHTKKIVLDFNRNMNPISDEAFNYTSEFLEELSLGACGITSLSVNLLNGMKNLHFLHLWGNRIQNIPRHFFDKTKDLKELQLWGNRIRSLDKKTFSPLRQLRKLDLDNNLLTEINPDALQPLPNLQVLHLGRNKITIIHGNTFKRQRKLRTLNLHSNRITTLRVPGKPFSGLAALRTLALNNNSLKYMSDECFSNHSRLELLYLQDNQIERLWVQAMNRLQSLQVVDLSRNNLTELPKEQFKRSNMLSQVYLDHNQITTLYENSFHSNVKLKTLSLINNKFNCSCGVSWIAAMAEKWGTEVWGSCDTNHGISDKRVYAKCRGSRWSP